MQLLMIVHYLWSVPTFGYLWWRGLGGGGGRQGLKSVVTSGTEHHIGNIETQFMGCTLLCAMGGNLWDDILHGWLKQIVE